MNQTLDVIYKRKSLRAYSTRLLSQEEKDAILNAAFRAPTAGNMMLYSIIEVDDQALKDHLAVTCDNQPFIAKAPFVLLFLADYQRWFDIYNSFGVARRCQELGRPFRKPAKGDLLLACCDALIAAQNAVIAAASLGIGSCYIGDILENYEIQRDIFSLPPYVLPITLLCFGHPASQSRSDTPTRHFEREFILHKNTYRRFGGDDLKRMLAPFEEQFTVSKDNPNGIENLAQSYYFRKFVADFALEMNRSVQEMFENWKG
jgi:nitroreductase